MSALQSIQDQISSIFNRSIDEIKKRVLGENNENIEFIMDSFYKLSPSQQSGALFAVFGVLVGFVFISFMLYVSRVSALEKDLTSGFEAVEELRSLKKKYNYERKKFSELENIVRRGSQGFRPKPFFESKANSIGVTITDLRDKKAPISPDSPLSSYFSQTIVEFKLPKVSLPRLMKFLSEVERSNKNLSIENLQIRTRYGDRLYFEATAKVVGYKVGGMDN